MSLFFTLSYQEPAAFLGLSERAVSGCVQAKERSGGRRRTSVNGVVWSQDKNDLRGNFSLCGLCHYSPWVNASFQEEDKSQECAAFYRKGEGSIGSLLSTAMPQLSFSLWGGTSGHGTPLLGSRNRCSYPALGALRHHSCAVGSDTPGRWNQQRRISEDRKP